MDIDGTTLHRWMRDLYPLCRSLTGEGVRQTLRYFQGIVPELTLHEVDSGTRCFDWTVPDEWNIEDAYVLDPEGNKIIDFQAHNLHVVGYSEPVDTVLPLEELDRHLHSREDMPEVIPYVTSYYRRYWGFCLPHLQRQALKPGNYRAVIKSRLAPGSLTYGEILLPGEESREVLITSYVCHPSLCNNELSGPVTAVGLAAWLRSLPRRRYSYRFYLGPETLGAICYLARNLETLKARVAAGFLLSNCGDEGPYTMVQSRFGDTLADKAGRHVLRWHADRRKAHSFLDRASDENQFNAPGVDLPLVSIQRTRYGENPEYHTSLDNLEHVTPAGLDGTFAFMRRLVTYLEGNLHYACTNTCAPQLGKRGLYPLLSDIRSGDTVETMLDFFSYADGDFDLLDIAEILGVPCATLLEMARTFCAHGLLRAVEPDPQRLARRRFPRPVEEF